jgi:hypothetical protein
MEIESDPVMERMMNWSHQKMPIWSPQGGRFHPFGGFFSNPSVFILLRNSVSEESLR